MAGPSFSEGGDTRANFYPSPHLRGGHSSQSKYLCRRLIQKHRHFFQPRNVFISACVQCRHVFTPDFLGPLPQCVSRVSQIVDIDHEEDRAFHFSRRLTCEITYGSGICVSRQRPLVAPVPKLAYVRHRHLELATCRVQQHPPVPPRRSELQRRPLA